MMFDEETEAKIDELADEIFEGVAEDRDVIFFEGGIVQSVPTGAPPEYITVEVEAIYDENVMWRGVPASLVVGDEVMVWENPKTHRREIAGGSGATTTSTSSPWQKITVAPSGADFTLLSAAIAWINALAAPIAPSATRLFAINMLGGTFVEAADVTIPQYVHVGGEGEGTVIDMGDATLIMSPDTSLQELVVTSTADDNWYVLYLSQADNAVVDDVRVIVTGSSGQQICVDLYRSDDVELYHVICESTQTTNWGFYIYGSTALLWDCKAHDTTNFEEGIRLGSAGVPSTATTKFCEFRAAPAGDDVNVLINNTWNHFACQFDPDNCTFTGTEVPLVTGKMNFDDVVTFENGVTMDGVSGGNVVTFPDNVANAMHFVDDTTGINFQQFISTAAAQATVFNIGEADVDFRVAVAAAASLTDPTHGFSMQGSTGNISMGVVPNPNAHLLIYNAIVNTVNQFYGLWAWHQKTAGVTDETDIMHGLDSSMVIDQAGGVVGHTRGGRYHAWLEQGTVGAAAQAADLMGIEAEADGDGGTIYGSAIGVNALVNIDGTAIDDTAGTGHVYGVRSIVDLGAGTIDGNVYGFYAWVDDDIGATTVYMLYLAEQTGVDYGVYQNGTAQNLFGGKVTLTSAELEFTAASGSNLLEIPTAQAIGFLLSDTAPIEYLRIDTAPQLGIIWNNGEADIDYRVAASGITNALFVQGSDGAITVDGPSMTVPDGWILGIAVGAERIVFDAAGDIAVMGANLGVGTLGPGAEIHVKTASPEVYIDAEQGTGSGANLRFFADRPADGNAVATIQAWNPSTAANAGSQIRFLRGSTDDHGDIAFWTAGAERVRIDEDGHTYPNGVKTQDLGLATNEWDDIYYVTVHVGTSRLVRSTRICPVCSTEMSRGTGTTIYRGETADYAVCFCLNCGNAAVEELNHLPPEKEAEKLPPPKIVLENVRVKPAGRNRSVAVDFRYGDDVLDATGEVVEQAVRNSTRLGEYEFDDFFTMNDKDRLDFLRVLGEREWYSREETRLMKQEAEVLKTMTRAKVSSWLGKDLLEETVLPN